MVVYLFRVTLYRLTHENITDNENGNYSASYQYDTVGNRIYQTIDGVQTQYSYDDNDRLIQQGGSTYSYDNNGNTLSETLDGNTINYHYDAKNKLIAVEKDGINTSYRYNHNGIRTHKTENGITTRYTIDENRTYAQVLLENDGTNSIHYTYGDDLISQHRNSVMHYYLYDGLGSTRALLDSNGIITDRYDYAAFGEILNQIGNTENDYLFAGEQFDQALGQYYLRARYYDQGVGRFTNMDTWKGKIREPITSNKYIYGNANPVSFTDPTGNFGLASIGTTSNIRGILSKTSVPSFSSAVSRAVGGSLQLSGRAVKKKALRTLRQCIRKKNKCGLLFNLLIVGYDNPDIANHIRSAQTASTVVLTYMRNKRGNRRWYATRGGTAGCRQPTPPSKQCDEYPFFKTKEGGAYKPGVSTRWVPARQNMSVGGHFGFLAKNMKNKDEFVVITSSSLPTVALPLGKRKK